MENKHKLDVLLEDLINSSKGITSYSGNIQINSQFNIKYIDHFKAAIRLDVGGVTLWFKDHRFQNIPTQDEIKELKDVWYSELLRYLVLTRIPIWKESTEIMTKRY